MSYALLKDRKLIKVTEDVTEVSASLMSGSADTVHNVKSLEELTALLDGGTQSGEEPVLTSLKQLGEYLELAKDRVLSQAKVYGTQGEEKVTEVFKTARQWSTKALEDVRAAIHEATKPKDQPAAPQE